MATFDEIKKSASAPRLVREGDKRNIKVVGTPEEQFKVRRERAKRDKAVDPIRDALESEMRRRDAIRQEVEKNERS